MNKNRQISRGDPRARPQTRRYGTERRGACHGAVAKHNADHEAPGWFATPAKGRTPRQRSMSDGVRLRYLYHPGGKKIYRVPTPLHPAFSTSREHRPGTKVLHRRAASRNSDVTHETKRSPPRPISGRTLAYSTARGVTSACAGPEHGGGRGHISQSPSSSNPPPPLTLTGPPSPPPATRLEPPSPLPGPPHPTPPVRHAFSDVPKLASVHLLFAHGTPFLWFVRGRSPIYHITLPATGCAAPPPASVLPKALLAGQSVDRSVTEKGYNWAKLKTFRRRGKHKKKNRKRGKQLLIL